MVTAKNKISKLNTQLRKEFYILNEVISPKGNLFDVKDNKAIDEDGKVAQDQLQLTGELREDQVLEEQNLSVNCIIETGSGKLISGGHGKHLIIYKRN